MRLVLHAQTERAAALRVSVVIVRISVELIAYPTVMLRHNVGSMQRLEKCPLNVCCSEFGFCKLQPICIDSLTKSNMEIGGTSKKFCGLGCDESSGLCGPTPTPRRGGNKAGRKAIAYYESWYIQNYIKFSSLYELMLTFNIGRTLVPVMLSLLKIWMSQV